MAAQAERGHQVSYFLSGRHYPLVSRTRLKRWRNGEVNMYEVVNPPIVAGLEHGTRDPDRELSEPRIEAKFRGVCSAVHPDVVHVHELNALPSSLIDIASETGASTVMTLQDYFPLCATLRLFDAEGRICTRREVGADCVARNAGAPTDNRLLKRDTLLYEITRARRRFPSARAVGPLLERAVMRRYRYPTPPRRADP